MTQSLRTETGMNELNYRDCAKLLQNSGDILILSHRNPDGDTAGSSAALCSALRRAGKTAYMYPNPQIGGRILKLCGKYFAPEDFEPGFTVAVDTADDKLLPEGYYGKAQLGIDHHPSNTGWCENLLLKADRSSCGEIILELIKSLAGKPTEEEATLLYMALSTDTGCFRYGNTNARSFSAAAELVRCGADTYTVNTDFFRKVTGARLKLEGEIFSSLRLYRGGKICVSVVTEEMLKRCGADEDDCEDLANLPNRLEGAELAITIRETKNGGSKVSVRSGKEVSASKICAVLGGGGHDMAAGCSLSCPPEKAEEKLLAVIDEVWKA